MSLVRVLAGAGVIVGAVAWSNRPSPADEHESQMTAADIAASVAPVVAATHQGTANLPPSNSTAAARLSASPRHGEWVKVAWEPGSADSLMAWIVHPSTSQAKSPVVVVVHENIGLTTWVRSVADQVAAEGFIAIAPDLLSRVRGGPSTQELPPDSVRGMIAGVNSTERNRGITAVATYAMSQPAAAPKYGVIGYCWGGGSTFMHAVNGGTTGFSGGVSFYGTPYMTGSTVNADSLARITKPVMLLNGAKDTRITTAMPAIDSIMKAHGKNYSFMNYEGAIHGFLRAQNDPRANGPRDEAEEAANLAAAKDAWPRTIEFLKKNLK